MKWIEHSNTLKWLDLGVKLGSVILLFWIIVSRVDVAIIAERLHQLSASGVLFVTLIFAGHTILSAVRWQEVIIKLGGNCSFRTALGGSLIERFVNQAVPTFVGGDGARILELVRSGENTRIAAYSVFFDRLFSLGGAFGLVLICLPVSILVVRVAAIQVALILISVIAMLAVCVLLMPTSFWGSTSRIGMVQRLSRAALILREFFLEPKLAALTVGLSVVSQALLVVCFWVLSADLRIDLRLNDAIALIPLVMLASVVPISLAGWGVREGAAAVLLSTVGISVSDAVALSLVFGVAYLATSCLAGAIWLILHIFGRVGAAA